MSTHATAAPRYTPYDGGTYRMAMGLRGLEEEDWLEPDRHFDAHLREKRQLLAERHAEVFAALPDSLDAQREVLELVIEHMTRRHPDLLRRDGDQLSLPSLSWTFHIPEQADAPLDLAGRIIQEDLCLMRPGPDGYELAAASLCFPSRWVLAEKLGKPMSAIHGPVPGFNAKLGRPVDKFFDTLQADKLVFRTNWGLHDSPNLFEPKAEARKLDENGTDPSITIDNAGERIWIRIERQTLRRLPRTGWILFTIKTLLDPLAALAGRADLAEGLGGVLASLPSDMDRYKNLAPYRAALKAYLKRLGGTS